MRFAVAEPLTFATLGGRTTVVGPEHGFLPGTEISCVPVNFMLNNAGMGDYICYSSALLWIARERPWVYGTLYVSAFMVPFFRLLFEPYPHWRVLEGRDIKLDGTVCTIGPDLEVGGYRQFQQLYNATGAHLVDLGFAYYANMSAPPEATYPYLSLPESRVLPAVRKLSRKYFVITTGFLTEARSLEGKHLNPLIEFGLEQGLTPVFLGKENAIDGHKTRFSGDIHYEKGLDLRNKTTILDAAAIMQYSACTLGLDNGLLHLASCTPGNVIFGYNIAGPSHREPRRTWGKLINVTVTREELACIHCQDRQKLNINHFFGSCYYKDYPEHNLRCRELLFAGEGAKWKAAIMQMLGERK